jgi:hypothetical protein
LVHSSQLPIADSTKRRLSVTCETQPAPQIVAADHLYMG